MSVINNTSNSTVINVFSSLEEAAKAIGTFVRITKDEDVKEITFANYYSIKSVKGHNETIKLKQGMFLLTEMFYDVCEDKGISEKEFKKYHVIIEANDQKEHKWSINLMKGDEVIADTFSTDLPNTRRRIGREIVNDHPIRVLHTLLKEIVYKHHFGKNSLVDAMKIVK